MNYRISLIAFTSFYWPLQTSHLHICVPLPSFTGFPRISFCFSVAGSFTFCKHFPNFANSAHRLSLASSDTSFAYWRSFTERASWRISFAYFRVIFPSNCIVFYLDLRVCFSGGLTSFFLPFFCFILFGFRILRECFPFFLRVLFFYGDGDNKNYDETRKKRCGRITTNQDRGKRITVKASA